jgi:hypothetical protein
MIGRLTPTLPLALAAVLEACCPADTPSDACYGGTMCGLFDVIEECKWEWYQCHAAWVVVRDCRAEGMRCASLDGEITCVP